MKRNIVKQTIAGLTLGAGLLAATVAPQAARAEDNSANTNESWVLVHPTTKGSSGAGWVRVPANSRTAHRARGMVRAINPAPATMQMVAQTAPALAQGDANTICRPVKFYNNKGARSVYPGQKLIRCAGSDGKRASGAPYCTADLPCANGSVCPIKMTCAGV